MLKRIVTAVVAAVLALAASAPAVHAQKALVYCPVGIDASGCDRIVSALQSAFADGVDRGYDGSNGTVDLTKVDLHHYGVFVVPSLADDATKQPYALLHSVASRLHFAITGRVAVYSGAPDQGSTNRTDKDALIQNLATWAANGHSRATGLVGLVAFLDLSENTGSRYSWVHDISLTDVSADAQLTAFSDVQAVSARGTGVLSAGGRSVRFTNMASYGLHIGRRASARTEVGALGGTSGAQSVLVMYANADGKDATTGGRAGTGKVGATGASLDVSGAKATLSTGSTSGATLSSGTASAPMITTDKPDYMPGDTVTFTGAGFAAGDTVTITVHEDPTWSYPDRQFVSVADANGGFVNRDMIVATQDLGVTFTATAVAVPSGLVAQTTFTDGNATSIGGTVTDASNSLDLAGVTVTCTAGCNNNPPATTTTSTAGSYAFSNTTTKLSFATNGPVTLTLTFAKAGYVSGTLTLSNVNNGAVLTNNDIALTPAATKLAFSTSAFTSTVNACFGPITVQTQNNAGTATNVTSTTTVNLTSDNGNADAGTAAFYGTSSCSSTIPSITIATGSNSGSFYYKATARGSGSHQLTASATGLTSVSQTETINRADQATLTATAPTTGTYGDHLTMTAAGGSGGGELGFAVVAGSTACSIITTQPDSGKLAITAGAGSCSITATKAQDNDYNSATSAALNVTVAKKTVTVATLTASNKTYNGTNAATLTGGTLSGVLANDEASVALDISGATANFADANAGTGKLVTATGLGLTGAASGNYVLNPTMATTTANIEQLGLVASITASGKEYDGTTTVTGTVNCTVATKIGTDDVACTATGAAFGSANAGPETVTANVALTGGAKANYTLGTQTQATVAATIAQKALTITANNQVKTYDGNPFSGFTASYSGLIAADAANGQPNGGVLTTAVTFGGPAATAVNAGSYSIDPSGATAANYSITFGSGTLTINQATATLQASGFTGPYDGQPHAGSCTAAGVANAAVTTNSTYNPGGSTVPVNAGSYMLTCAVTGQQNYKDASTSEAIEIAKVAVTVKADDKMKTYDGGAFSPFTSAFTGFVSNEGSGVVSGSVTYTGTAIGAVNAGTYTITPGVTGLSATNYTFTPSNGTLVIKQAPLTITADNKEKTYDGTPFTGFSASYSGLITADQTSDQPKAGVLLTSVTFGGDAAAAVNAGTYTIVPSGATATNYAITFGNGSLKINQVTLTVSAPSFTVTYGDPVPSPISPAYSGFVNSENATNLTTAPSCTTSYTTSSDAGSTQSTSCSGAVATNYSFNYVNGTVTVNQAVANVSVSGFTGVYDGSAHGATGTATGAKSENLGSLLNFGATFTNVPGGTANWTFAGNTNYKPASGAVAITISKADPTILVSGYSAPYDGNAHGATGSAKGVKGETLSGLDLGTAFTNVPGGTANWAFIDITGNYNNKNGSVLINIAKADPMILWSTPAAVNQGTVLSSTQLNAAAQGVKKEVLDGSFVYNPSEGTPLFTPGSTPLSVTFTPSSGNYNGANKSVSIQVNNVAPTVTSITLPSAPLALGSTATLTAQFTDPGLTDTHTYQIDWDWDLANNAPTAGSFTSAYTAVNSEQTLGGGAGSITASYKYPAAGVYTVRVTVMDNGGLTGSRTSQNEIFAYIVVFDASGGFVTGGGWINSPAGACQLTAACGGAVGKASFGFTAKYKKGQSTPDGNTEFQFQAGNLNFHSGTYDWLVVAGNKAQYKGIGTINGQGTYGFLLTAVDNSKSGTPDTFRMKIWIKNADGTDGPVVYDNQLGAADDGTPTTALGGGSITVHQ